MSDAGKEPDEAAVDIDISAVNNVMEAAAVNDDITERVSAFVGDWTPTTEVEPDPAATTHAGDCDQGAATPVIAAPATPRSQHLI